MSVALTTPPPAFAFSADMVSARFTSLSYFDQVGVNASNYIVVATRPVNGNTFVFRYGAKNFTITVKTTPNDSGLEVPAVPPEFEADLDTCATILAASFRENADLNEDFTISATSGTVYFVSKKAGKGFDFLSGSTGTNGTAGVEQVIKPNYSITFKLYIENADNTAFENIYTSQLQLINGTAGQSEARISDKLHSAIEADLRKLQIDKPGTTAIACTKSCRKYYFEFAESYGETITVKKLHRSDNYTILHGGLSTRAQFNTTLSTLLAPSTADNDRFLKQGATNVYTRTNQPQYLYFFNTRAIKTGAQLVANVSYADGTSATDIVIETLTLAQLRKYAFNVTFDNVKANFAAKTVSSYTVFLKHSGSQISEQRIFTLDYSQRQYLRYFLNWSSFGGLDTRLCYGKGESEFELFNKTAERIKQQGEDIRQGNRFTFGSKLTRQFAVATGFISRRDLQLNADFYLSDFKYRYTGGLMLPIEIPAGKIPELQDGNNLYAQKFEYKYLFDDHAYTEGDAEDNGDMISDFFFSSPTISGAIGSFVETDPTVPAWVKTITLADINRWNSATNPSDLSNFYNRSEIAAILNGSPSLPGYNKTAWDTAASKTNLSQFTNDLGNYGNWITKAQADTYYPSLTGYNKTAWDTAVGWGNHAGLYQPLENQRLSKANNVEFAGLKAVNYLTIPNVEPSTVEEGLTYLYGAPVPSTPPTVHVVTRLADLLDVSTAGDADWVMYKKADGTFGFKSASFAPAGDVYTKTEIAAILNGSPSLAGYNKTNWDTAFGWGNHAAVGYLTSVSWGMVNGRPTNLSAFVNDLGNYGSFAYSNGSNATGTWGIDINGSAVVSSRLLSYNGANSIYWGWDGNSFTAKVDNADFGNTIPINISGNAANSSLWNGLSIDWSVDNQSPAYFLGWDATVSKFRPANINGTKAALNLPSDSSLLHRSIGFAGGYPGANANTVAENTSSFSYANNAPYNGALVHFGNGGSGLQFSAGYGNNYLAYRNRNGDNGTWQSWNQIVFDGYDVTWNLNINGSAQYLQGYQSSVGSIGDTIVRRDINGYINGTYFKMSGPSVDETAFTDFVTTMGDGYLRRNSAGAVRAALGLTSGAYDLEWVTSNGNSTTNPIQAQRIIAGYDSGVAGSVNASNGFRAIGNTGLYWSDYQIGLFSENTSTTALYSNTNAIALRLATNGNETRGYVNADSSNNIGFLNNGAGWAFRIDAIGWAFANSFNADNWFRSTGASGWFNSTYAGGIYMEDGTWVRTYNGRGFYVSGGYGIRVEDTVKADQGFHNTAYVAGRNRIWSFANADNYGLSYHQGSGSIYGQDGIGIHFGNANAPQFNFKQDGLFYATSKIEAPTLQATTKLLIPTTEPAVASGEVALYWGAI